MAALNLPSECFEKRTIKVVCISDTHGRHRDLTIPDDAEILIHAGDFTHFGKLKDAQDFNLWLGSLPIPHKIVVNGNHEHNAEWQKDVKAILSNATHLLNEYVKLPMGGTQTVNVYGTDFFWPTTPGAVRKRGICNPLLKIIPPNGAIDILVTHGPAAGVLDDGSGCHQLRAAVLHAIRPRYVVSGHIHQAHGVCSVDLPPIPQNCLPPLEEENSEQVEAEEDGEIGFDADAEYMTKEEKGQCVFVNAANCHKGYTIGWGVVTLELPVKRVLSADE